MRKKFLGVLLWQLLCVNAQASRPSTPYFEGARLARRQQLSVNEACDRLADSWKTFCIEGYYFQDAFDTWRYQNKIMHLWPIPLPASHLQAISIGMALGYLGEPIPLSYLGRSPQQDYIIDGWSFTYHLTHPHGQHSCWNGPWVLGHEICQYAQGRAHFFKKTSPPLATAEPAIKTGFSFAQSYHLEPPFRSGPMKGFIESLNDPARRSLRLRSCLKLRHYYYCRDL